MSINKQINSIIEHDGLYTNEGHYTAKRYNRNNDIWTHHDDDKEPVVILPRNIVTRDAYIVFYERIVM